MLSNHFAVPLGEGFKIDGGAIHCLKLLVDEDSYSRSKVKKHLQIWLKCAFLVFFILVMLLQTVIALLTFIR
jgi:hypothetical protein